MEQGRFATTFSYGPIQIGNLSKTSGVFIGRNVHTHFTAKSKVNEGHLTLSGTGATMKNNQAIVIDQDVMDNKTE